VHRGVQDLTRELRRLLVILASAGPPHSGVAGRWFGHYARMAHLSASRVTSTVKRPSPSGMMTRRPRA